MKAVMKAVKMNFFQLLIFLICTVSHATSDGCAPEDRITPLNHIKSSKKNIEALKNFAQKNETSPWEALLIDVDKTNEVCAWNRFILLDFVLYFGQTGKLTANEKDADVPLLAAMAMVRDQLYANWLTKIRYKEKTGFFEHENNDVNGMSLDDYTALKSSLFGKLEIASGLMECKNCKVSKKERKFAKWVAQTVMDGKTPFNSIFAKDAFRLVLDQRLMKGMTCLRDSYGADLEHSNCAGIRKHPLKCGLSPDDMVLIFGVFASQRMYLLRDFKTWLEQNKPENEYDRIMHDFAVGSQLYFLLETTALRCNASAVVPEGYDTETNKVYHFYSNAFLAKRMKEFGLSHENAKKMGLNPARTYKRLIGIPGIIYNLFLGEPLFSGTVSDKKILFKLQSEGFDYGWNL